MVGTMQCRKCLTFLPEAYGPEPRLPCPVCRETVRVYSEYPESNLKLSGSATQSVKYGHTGREVLGADAEVYAGEWADLKTVDELRRHPAAADFHTAIQTASTLSGNDIVLVRGQGIKTGQDMPPSIGRMGPLPLNRIPGEGRYHRAGERVLYLAESEDGARREMAAWKTEGIPYAIELELPVSSMRIADFVDWPIDHLVTAAFAKAESCKIKDRGPDSYEFSQLIGELVSAHFDGMRLPGVRGEPGAQYANVVLFKHLEDWQAWVGARKAFIMTGAEPAHDLIAVAAYYIWESEGRPHGRDKEHWQMATDFLRGSK